VNKFHPSLYSLLREFQRQQAATESMIAELDLGRKVREPQKKKYRDVTTRLQTITAGYQKAKDSGEILAYLRACGNTFSL